VKSRASGVPSAPAGKWSKTIAYKLPEKMRHLEPKRAWLEVTYDEAAIRRLSPSQRKLYAANVGKSYLVRAFDTPKPKKKGGVPQAQAKMLVALSTGHGGKVNVVKAMRLMHVRVVSGGKVEAERVHVVHKVKPKSVHHKKPSVKPHAKPHTKPRAKPHAKKAHAKSKKSLAKPKKRAVKAHKGKKVKGKKAKRGRSR
jgi:hypothetical protein